MPRVLSRPEFEEIMEGNSHLENFEGDNGLEGLLIIRKYVPHPKDVLCGASHDEIWSVYVKELLDGGITKEDAKKLRDMNWMIDEDSLACYV